jgi:hypothetical protein
MVLTKSPPLVSLHNQPHKEQSVKPPLLLLVTIFLTGAAAAVVFTKEVTKVDVDTESLMVNAAYRDGLYQGKMDAQETQPPHLTSGRWNAEADRGSYIAGYRSGYEQVGDYATGQEPASPTPAWIGFQDGLKDGKLQRQHSQQFQGRKTANYLRADRGYSTSEGDREQYRAMYRDAYANGYQQGFYRNETAANTVSF